MHAHKIWAAQFTLCLMALFVVATGCNRPRKVETEAAKQQPQTAPGTATAKATAAAVADVAVKRDVKVMEKETPPQLEIVEETVEEAAKDVTSVTSKAAAQAELSRQLKRLKFKARREIVAARTTIENIPSYSRSLEKFEREFEQWGMFTRIPKEPKFEELKGEVTDVVEKLQLELLHYNILESKEEKRKLPEVIHGNKSFTFEDNDVREAFQVTVRIARVPRDKQMELLGKLKGLERMLLVRRFKLLPDSILINMDAYWFDEERYPLHRVLPRDLQDEMQKLGITGTMEDILQQDTVGYLQNAALSYKELNASLPKINEAMGLLSRSKFLQARSAFFRKASETAAAATPVP